MKPPLGRSGARVGVLGAELSSSVNDAIAVRPCTVGGCSRRLIGDGTLMGADDAIALASGGGGSEDGDGDGDGERDVEVVMRGIRSE